LKTALLLLAQVFLAPDGGGGGGSPPASGEPLADWIKRLNEAEKKDRKAIVEEMAKALGLKTGDAYQKLKDAGWDPKGGGAPPAGNTPPMSPDPAAGTPSAPPDPPGPPAKTFPVKLRHKTPHPHYRRAGLVLTGQFKPYEVTGDQFEILKKDAWVEIEK
jgi:hypothetical protein